MLGIFFVFEHAVAGLMIQIVSSVCISKSELKKQRACGPKEYSELYKGARDSKEPLIKS
jgi:hypothetical protein